MNRARAWLPVLLALSANSPFWSGRDTGFMSYRTEVWQRWPTAGFGPVLKSRAHFDDLTAELQAIGAIEDTTFLYWYMRPSSRYPTVEFRICDVPLLVEDTVTIAGLIRALAWSCRRDALLELPELVRGSEAMEAAMWRAARYGLRAELVHPVEPRTAPAHDVVERFLEYVGDGLDAHGDRAVIEASVANILERGNGAELQLAAFGDNESMDDVVDAVVRSGTMR
jgi:carboxylate-amine ligase